MSTRAVVLLGAIAAAGLVALSLPPIPQPAAYHRFADSRTLLGIPNCLNVISNIPFAVVGIAGLASIFRRGGAAGFANHWERWPYAALFVGVLLTTAGSSYYHLAPDNARLVWDRLPMAVGFMGLLTAVLAERVSLRTARLVFIPLLLFGLASVVLWHWSELRGAGDLRLYGLAQFGSLALILLMLMLYPARNADGHYLVAGLGLYAAAKGLELADQQIFALGGIVSGHTLKHLAAAAGVWCIVAMIRFRRAK